MLIIRITFLLFILYFINGKPDDYQTMVKNIRIEYYNSDLASSNSSFKLFKYNRTQFALNLSVWILEDLNGREIESSTKAYAFLSNAFKFTGIQIKIPNLCKMWTDNDHEIREIFSKCGSQIDLCDIKKGHFHLSNCWPADSIKYFPKSIPQGSYKVTMESKMFNGTPLVTIAWYGKASMFFKEMKPGKGFSQL